MTDRQALDYEELRVRFPWVGLASFDGGADSSRCREILAGRRADPAAGSTPGWTTEASPRS